MDPATRKLRAQTLRQIKQDFMEIKEYRKKVVVEMTILGEVASNYFLVKAIIVYCCNLLQKHIDVLNGKNIMVPSEGLATVSRKIVRLRKKLEKFAKRKMLKLCRNLKDKHAQLSKYMETLQQMRGAAQNAQKLEQLYYCITRPEYEQMGEIPFMEASKLEREFKEMGFVSCMVKYHTSLNGMIREDEERVANLETSN